MRRVHTIALVFLVLALYLALSFAEGRQIDASVLLKTTLVASTLGACVWVFDKWLWKLPFLHGWFVLAPNIDGEWNVSGLIFNPMTKKEEKKLSGKIKINQTFFSIKFEINWDDHGVSKTIKSNKLAIEDEGMCAFTTVFSFDPVERMNVSKYHNAGVFFHSNECRPKDIVLRYATSEHHVGVLRLTAIK